MGKLQATEYDIWNTDVAQYLRKYGELPSAKFLENYEFEFKHPDDALAYDLLRPLVKEVFADCVMELNSQFFDLCAQYDETTGRFKALTFILGDCCKTLPVLVTFYTKLGKEAESYEVETGDALFNLLAEQGETKDLGKYGALQRWRPASINLLIRRLCSIYNRLDSLAYRESREDSDGKEYTTLLVVNKNVLAFAAAREYWTEPNCRHHLIPTAVGVALEVPVTPFYGWSFSPM